MKRSNRKRLREILVQR